MKTTKDLLGIDPLQFATMSYIEVIDAKEAAAKQMFHEAGTKRFALPNCKASLPEAERLNAIMVTADKALDYMRMWREEVGLTSDLDTLLEKAYDMCVEAHFGQFRKDGRTPYANHPIAVADMMDTKLEKIVALLHDVVEDTSVTLQDISRIFGPLIAKYVGTLTKEKGQNYWTYIHCISECEFCTKIKLGDMDHNSKPGASKKQLRKYRLGRLMLKGKK